MHANKTKFERYSPLAVRVLIFSLQKNKTKQNKNEETCKLKWFTVY